MDWQGRIQHLLPFNLTTNSTLLDNFKHWNYTVDYNTGTIGNGSNCVIAFHPYVDTTWVYIENGTILNGTSCDSTILPVAARAGVSIAFAVVVIMIIPVTIVSLKKHGATYMPRTKRISILGRRWQYYWVMISIVLTAVAGFFGIDVDRDYMQGVALAVFGIFWAASGCAITAAVWELIRNW